MDATATAPRAARRISMAEDEEESEGPWTRGRVASAAAGMAAAAVSDPILIPELIVQASTESTPEPQAGTRRLSRAGRLVRAAVRLERARRSGSHVEEAAAEEEEVTAEDEDEDDRVITLDEGLPAAAGLELEDTAISLTAQLKAAALVGFDAVTNRLARLALQYPVSFLALQARMRAPLGCWPGPLGLICRLTPLGLYRYADATASRFADD